MPLLLSRTKVSLNAHTKNHSESKPFDGRPFACGVFACDKSYSTDNFLKKHLRTHSGEGSLKKKLEYVPLRAESGGNLERCLLQEKLAVSADKFEEDGIFTNTRAFNGGSDLPATLHGNVQV